MPAPIDLYYWTTPNGWKVSIALEEMGLPYTIKLVDIDNVEQNNPEFLALAPNAKIPMMLTPTGRMARPLPSLKAARSCNTSPAKQASSTD